MRKKLKNRFMFAGIMLLLFIAFTCMVANYDVQSIGPEQSSVGFATLNRAVFERLGVHLIWYHITDWLGVVAILCAFGFALLGLIQLIRQKSLWKVDKQLTLLGAFYVLVVACYLFFERVVINCRPIILGTSLEASYPSSHTMIVVCIMASAVIALRSLYPTKKKLLHFANVVSIALISVTVVGRLISGVHWFTDIIGGLLLSATLVALYDTAIKYTEEREIR